MARTKKQALKAAGFKEEETKSEVVATLELQLLDKQLAEHDRQFQELQQNMGKLEEDFNQKKEWARNTLSELRGAILALRGLRESATTETKQPE